MLLPANIWSTESKFWTWLRGGLRRAVWQNNPIKLEFIKANRIRIPGLREGTERWGGICNKCKKKFPQSSLQVDHIEGNISLLGWDDIEDFVKHMALPSELQLLCKPCHKIKTMAERYDLTFEQAKAKYGNKYAAI